MRLYCEGTVKHCENGIKNQRLGWLRAAVLFRLSTLPIAFVGVLHGLNAEGSSGGGFGVGGKLALPRAIAGRPAEAVLFQCGACLFVGLFVKEYLEAVGFEVVDDLAAGEFCAFGWLLGLLLAFVQLVEAGLCALDLAAQAG